MLYYNNISMSVVNDDYFDLILNNAWNLDGSKKLIGFKIFLQSLNVVYFDQHSGDAPPKSLWKSIKK